MVQTLEEKPPYVTFEQRPVEDRTATLEYGHYIAKDVAFAIITPPGSRDKIEKEAEIWLKDIAEHVRNGRYPANWLEHFKAMYAAWKEGREIPEEGTPILTWPAISPAVRDAILAANIRTVEHLAEANEAAISGIGIGGRSVKQQAVAWLETVKDTGKIAAEVTALRQKDIENVATIAALSDRLAKLETADAKKAKETA